MKNGSSFVQDLFRYNYQYIVSRNQSNKLNDELSQFLTWRWQFFNLKNGMPKRSNSASIDSSANSSLVC